MATMLLEDSAAATLLCPARTVRLSGVEDQSIVDGPGLRMTVFAQGCPHGCPGCHNPGTHGFDGGREWEVEALLARFDDNPLLAGVTLSGGEPLAQAGGLLPFAEAIKLRGKSVWCYTGYTFEELTRLMRFDGEVEALLHCVDVLVDGRYIESRRSLGERYRGSSNQRILNLARSLRDGCARDFDACAS